jgi:hypothetical protein
MQLKKILAAGALAAIMAGSTVAFAATLADFPSPFITGGNVQSLVVVGAAAAPSDVVGAIDVAARLGGESTTDYTCTGTSGGVTVSGEGKAVATTNTKLYLNDDLGKTGVRSTMTKDDLPTVLANGVLSDTDASTTHNYQQFIYLTPGTTNPTKADIRWGKPGSTSGVDPTYVIGEQSTGRLTTSPTTSEYLYKLYVTFDKDVNGSTAVGEKLTLFGKEYTIASTTSTAFTGATTDKLVLFGGAQTSVVNVGEKVTITIGGKDYAVTLKGVSSTTQVVVVVGSDTQSITKGSSKKVGGVDVYVDDAYYLSTTDQTQNSAKLLLGAEKITLTHNSKVKTGDTEDNVDGTLVTLTASSGKLSAITIYVAGKSSSNDYIKMGDTYTDPIFKSFSLAFPSVEPGLTDSTRSVLTVTPSGDNLLQLGMKDANGAEKTINWAYKASSTGTTFSLADNSGNAIHVLENESIARDEYFVVDAGDFSHLYKLTSTSIDGTSSSNIEITDQFSGVTTKVDLGTDNVATKVLDGQTYYFNTTGTTGVKVTWGTNAADHVAGDYVTVFPRLKGAKGEFVALTTKVATVPLISGKKYQLPTGALLATYDSALQSWNFTATTKEDGTASSLYTGDALQLNATTTLTTAARLGRTASAGTYYNLTYNSATSFNITVGGNSAIGQTQPGFLVVEEKDADTNQNTIFVYASTEASGTNNVAIPTAPAFTDGNAQNSPLGSDSTITDYVDTYGTYVKRTTTGQDTVKIYYPDDQVIANIYVLASDATTSTTTAAAGATVKQAVPVKTALGKLDTDVTSSDKTNKNLILVGGPAVNTLVKELADAGKTKARDWYISQGEGTAIIDLVADAFTSGKSALVVAGHSAADTRAATGILQTYDSYATQFKGKTQVVIKNGVISTTTA